MWCRGVCSLIVIASVSAASAEGIRGQGFVFDFNAGGGAVQHDTTAPVVLYGLGFGYALDRAASLAVGVELDGFASWTQGVRRDRAAFLGTVKVWLGDEATLKLGAGTPVGPAAIGEGFTAFVRVGYEVKRWERTALMVSLDATEDTTAGPQVSVLIGFDVFSHARTMNLWTPRN